MNKITEIWQFLENDQHFSTGILLRRYSSSIIPDICGALIAQGRKQAITVSISTSIDISFFNTLQDIKLEIIPEPHRPNYFLLLIILNEQKHKDIFSVLCEDLILAVAEESNESSLITILVNRITKWVSLFKKVHQQGLMVNEQIGLFGELYFLKQLLEFNINYFFCLDTWTGPTSAARDFQHGNWAVEVKSTTSINPQKIKISNERQLDSTLISNLFLVHYSFEALNNKGETLNDIIESIIQLLINEPVLEQRFIYMLFEAGYFPHHQNLYSKVGYSLYQARYFQVEELFPKLTNSTIPNGVSDITYSINISTCEQFLVTERKIFESIENNT